MKFTIKKLLESPKFHWIIFAFGIVLCSSMIIVRYQFTKSVIGGDAVRYYITTRSMVIDQDLDFHNEYRHFYNVVSPFTGNRKIGHIPTENPQTGKIPNKYPIGTSILIVPFFIAAHILSILLNLIGFNIAHDGYGPIYQLLCAFGSLLYTFIGILIIYRWGKWISNPISSFLGAVLMWLATPLVYYSTMEPLMSHTFSMFMVTMFLFFWIKTRGNLTVINSLMLGLLGGLMSIVRFQDMLFVLIPLIDILFFSPEKFLNRLKYLSTFWFAFGVGVSPQLYMNHTLYGSILRHGYTHEGFPYWSSPKVLYTLFSGQSGLLLWSPVLIFSLFGSIVFLKKQREIGWLFILGFLLQLYVVSSWWDVSQGDSFGNRMLLNSTFILATWLISFIGYTSSKKEDSLRYIVVVSMIFITINLLLIPLYSLRVIGNPY